MTADNIKDFGNGPCLVVPAGTSVADCNAAAQAAGYACRWNDGFSPVALADDGATMVVPLSDLDCPEDRTLSAAEYRALANERREESYTVEPGSPEWVSRRRDADELEDLAEQLGAQDAEADESELAPAGDLFELRIVAAPGDEAPDQLLLVTDDNARFAVPREALAEDLDLCDFCTAHGLWTPGAPARGPAVKEICGTLPRFPRPYRICDACWENGCSEEERQGILAGGEVES